jgi:hypothetical protein
MNQRTLFTAALLSSACGGCGIQLTTGLSTGQRDALPRVLTLESRFHNPRRSGPYLGGVTTLSLGDQNQPIHLRSGALTAGYHFAPGGIFAWEVGPEIGLGEPSYRAFTSPGFYAGAGGAVLARIAGQRDDEPVYQIFSGVLDVVVQVRGGVWSGPESAHAATVPVLVGGLGLRGTLSTDLVHSRPLGGEKAHGPR